MSRDSFGSILIHAEGAILLSMMTPFDREDGDDGTNSPIAHILEKLERFREEMNASRPSDKAVPPVEHLWVVTNVGISHHDASVMR